MVVEFLLIPVEVFSEKHRRCLGSRLGDYGRSEIECQDPVDGRWTSCGRAGAAEIAWEEARDGGARSKVRIRWTGGGRAVDGLWTGGSCRNSMGGGYRDGGARLKVRIRWTGGGRAVDGREVQK